MLPSIIRLHKLATLEKNLIARRLGSLPPADHQHSAFALGRIFAKW